MDYTKHVGVYLWSSGPPTDIPTAQAARGWAFVEEDTLEDYLLDKGVALPPEASSAGNKKLELALAATAQAEPDWSLETALTAIHKGQ